MFSSLDLEGRHAARTAPWYRVQTDSWMVQLDRKRHTLARGRENRQQALAKFYELMRLRASNPAPDTTAPTVASIIELYLDHNAERLAPDSLAVRKRDLQAFAESVGWKEVADCRAFDLTQWLADNPQLRSDWTVSTVIAVIQRPFNWASRQGLIAANPFKGVSRPRGQSRRPLTNDEYQAVLRSACGRSTKTRPTPGARFREVLVFLRFTGCRPCEARKLQWSEVDFDSEIIVIKEHKTSRTQKRPQPRVIPLDPVVLKLLAHVRRRHDPGPHVFLTYRGTPWTRNSLALRIRRRERRLEFLRTRSSTACDMALEPALCSTASI